jgi:hypothetical protein
MRKAQMFTPEREFYLSSQLPVEDYELQYALQNATAECVPGVPSEAFYVYQFQKMLHQIPSNLPVSSTNRMEVVAMQSMIQKRQPVVKPPSPDESETSAVLPRLVLVERSDRRANSNEPAPVDGLTNSIMKGQVLPPAETSKFVLNKNKVRFSEYLRSKHAHKVRAFQAVMTWKISESRQLLCFFLKQIGTDIRQYLLRT